MVCVTEFRRLVWFRVEILIVCLLAWSRPFAMAENSIVDSGVKGMSCSTPVNPFKPTKPFTPASDSSVNYFGSPSRRFHSANPHPKAIQIIIRPICLHNAESLTNLLKIQQIMMVVSRFETI